MMPVTLIYLEYQASDEAGSYPCKSIQETIHGGLMPRRLLGTGFLTG